MRLPFHNTQIKHWNPGCSEPLILPVHVICNTPDDEIHSNIRANSRLPKRWQRAIDAHDGVAVLCGSGPSLADTLDEIRSMRDAGALVFALNGAAKYLADNGILPDYQVIIDARAATSDVVAPAKRHLFASQVSPLCFARVPDAGIWHLQVDGIDSLLPKYEHDYCLIGGAASVGNTATCLAYAMGFRSLHCFGYDSSHRGTASHAFDQPMNKGDPCAWVTYNGVQYLTSFTMKLQAERFQDTARALKSMGCKIAVHGSGLLPAIYNGAPETLTEQEKYRRVWMHDDYRLVAPGEHVVETFLAVCKPSGWIADFGCGTGRAALAIRAAGHEVICVDFADNCMDVEARALPFICADITAPMSVRASYGFCTDVMEHIPPHQVDGAITSIMASVCHAFFQISTTADEFGESTIGAPLHLSVHPHSWWADKFTSLGFKVEWSEERQIASLFYVTKED